MLKKVLKVLNILFTTALVLMILGSTFLSITARRSQDALPSIAGRKVLTIISGSMEPTIHVGDVIVVKPGNEAKEGDVITFRSQEDPNVLITHRVAGLLLINEKLAGYVTKGDNNPTIDTAPVPLKQVVGLYQWRVPYFGYLATFSRKPFGIILLVIVPGLLIIGGELKKLWHAVGAAEEPDNVEGAQGKEEAG